MAVAIGVQRHSTLYAFLSLAAHGRIAGNDVVHVARGADEHVQRFEPLERPQDREALAFNARRTLHEVYAVVARDWLGYVPLLPTRSRFRERRTHEKYNAGRRSCRARVTLPFRGSLASERSRSVLPHQPRAATLSPPFGP